MPIIFLPPSLTPPVGPEFVQPSEIWHIFPAVCVATSQIGIIFLLASLVVYLYFIIWIDFVEALLALLVVFALTHGNDLNT